MQDFPINSFVKERTGKRTFEILAYKQPSGSMSEYKPYYVAQEVKLSETESGAVLAPKQKKNQTKKIIGVDATDNYDLLRRATEADQSNDETPNGV